MNIKYLAVLTITACILGEASLYARAVRLWSYDELLKASDVVAIIEPIKSENNQDQFEWADARSLIQGVSTTFKVHCYFKGASSATEIIVRHFNGKTAIAELTLVNAPSLVHFPIGPQNFDVSASQKDQPSVNKVIERVSTINTPRWLAFLKQNSDGTFAPVAGQVDSTISFRWLADHIPGSLEP